MADEKEPQDPPPAYMESAEDERAGILSRWMSTIIVLLAVAGFFGLAWYAYRSGGEAMNEKDVELVKADTAPVKEAPANPGGMEIPNQDKTVYGLIGNGKSDKPVAEHILPPPENPLRRGGDTDTWMSPALKNNAGGGGTEEAQAAAEALTAPTVTVRENAPAAGPPAAQVAADNPSAVVAPAKPKVTGILPPPPQAQADEKDASAPPAAAATPKAAAPVARASRQVGKGARVQLGAYKSQDEAEANWKRIARKFPDAVSGKQHFVLRVDLAGKGVFYRLQLAPFASAKEAEAFCRTLTDKGQGCIPARGK